MPRIPSLSMLTTDDAKLYLKELYGNVIENVMKTLISAKMKNRDLSGDPSSGSVVAKRFANAKPQKYGTARAAGKGEKIKGEEVVVQIDDDQEIVEEIEEKDVKLGGVDGLMDRRSANHIVRMASDLDTKFFACAFENAIQVEVDLTGPVEEVLETMIQELENTKNAFVDGVPRQMIRFSILPGTGKSATSWIKPPEPTWIPPWRNSILGTVFRRIPASTCPPAAPSWSCVMAPLRSLSRPPSIPPKRFLCLRLTPSPCSTTMELMS